MNKITFVAFLYILAGTGLLLGSAELFMKVRFDLGSERAVMKSTDPVAGVGWTYVTTLEVVT